jgi:putative nucleotidyltransferase with HDIG domain
METISHFNPFNQPANKDVFRLAETAGLKIYLVGGFIRDFLLNKEGNGSFAKDLDFAVAGGPAIEFARQVAESLSGHFVLLDEKNDTARVVLDEGINLDFAGCVGGSIENDIKRRDFTINALAWDAAEPEKIIDLVGGMDDIKTLTIRAISEDNLVDDPLRLLRAFRFSATTSGAIDKVTLGYIGKQAKLLATVAPERISYELFLLMEHPAFAVTQQMAETGLLEVIFPELTACRKVTTNAYHHLGLFDHSLELLKQAESRLNELPQWALDSFAQPISFGITRLSATKVACLLHDIGKPDTWQITDEGRHTFYGHDNLGAEMTETISERLRWSKPLSRFIVKLVKWHLRPGQLYHQGPPTTKAVHRFYRNVGFDLPELMLLAFADLDSTCGAGLPEENKSLLAKNLIELFHGFSVFINEQRSTARFLDGNEVMHILGIKAGPIVGELLDLLDEAQGVGEITDKDQAKQFIKQAFENQQSAT